MELSEENIQRLVTDFSDVWDKEDIRQIMEEALCHKAARKYANQYLYLRNWLRRDAEIIRRHPGFRPRSTERAVERYYNWGLR